MIFPPTSASDKSPYVIDDLAGHRLGVLAREPAWSADRPLPDRAAFNRAVFVIPPADRPPADQRDTVLAALRRALMSLDRDHQGAVSTLFSGHEEGPAPTGPSSPGHHRHVFLAAAVEAGHITHLHVFAPWTADRTGKPQPVEAQRFADTTARLSRLRAGPAGTFDLRRDDDAADEIAMVWQTAVPYRPTRHPKPRDDTAAFIAADIRLECARRGLPEPRDVMVCAIRRATQGGLCADVTLTFARTVTGPILLGRGAHAGYGWFRPEAPITEAE